MPETILGVLTSALHLAVFERNAQNRLLLSTTAPSWLTAVWPDLSDANRNLDTERSPFLENFLIDAVAAWQLPGNQRIHSGPWIERDASGQTHCLQATAIRSHERQILLIEELGTAYQEHSSIVQKAREAALAHEQVQRAQQALEEERNSLERRVRERTAELSRVNAELTAEVRRRQQYAEQLEAMHEIDKAILAAESPRMIAEAALRRIHPLLPFEHVSVLELDPQSGGGTLLATAVHGNLVPTSSFPFPRHRLDQLHVLNSVEIHRSVNNANLITAPQTEEQGTSETWALIVDIPLVAEDSLVGVLNLATNVASEFTLEHEKIAQTISSQLAVAIRQAQLFREISDGRKQLRSLSLRVVETQEKERRFMARELHDEIGQLLTGLKLNLKLSESAKTMPTDSDKSVAIGLVDELISRVRQLSLDLRPPVLDDLGLLPALDWLFKRYFRQTNIRVRFQHTPLATRLSPELETAVFRITQEALTNVARHAGVFEATVRLWYDPCSLRIQIEDKGAGFAPDFISTNVESTGLTGMRERALVLGGEFTIDSTPGEGTRVTVEWPQAALSSSQSEVQS